MKRKITLLVLAVLVLVVFAFQQTEYTGLVIQDDLEHATVVRVIDGDTVVLDDGRTVRFLGIDTPEKGQYYSQQATDWLVDRVEGKEVRLESGQEDKDKYDRYLRYVYVGNSNMNLELLEGGFATAYVFEEDAHTEDIYQAEMHAKQKQIGIWTMKLDDAFCIGIYQFRYNAYGNDNENLNGEYVIFRNKCTYPVDVTGWTVQDSRETAYMFGELIVDPKTTLTLYTGSGTDTTEEVYWDRIHAVWNNDGDTLLMFDAAGNKMLEYAY